MITHRISPLLGEHASLSLAGMCKNAGKTTVLNRIILELGQLGEHLALTSIGRDGESEDVATGTKKPRIYVREGTVFATSSDLLSHCDTSSEILEKTGVYTPLGEVILLRAHSDGFVDLAGPSMNQQLVALSERFRSYQPDRIIIDGAISRKSLCSRNVADEVILCTGASYHRNLDTVIEDTAFFCDLFQLPQMENRRAVEAIKRNRSVGSSGKFLPVSEEGEADTPQEGQTLSDILREKKYLEDRYVWVEGAVTDSMLRPILMSNIPLKDRVFVVEDSSKLLLNRDIYDKLKLRGGQIQVLSAIRLAAVTVNPFSAYGNHFDGKELKEKMQRAVNIPVIDVMEDMK